MKVKNEESRIKLQFSQTVCIVSIFLHNSLQQVSALAKTQVILDN